MMDIRINKILLILPVSFSWIVFFLFFFVDFDNEISWSIIVLLVIYIYASLMLWNKVFDNSLAPLEIMFWLFHTNFLLLPAIYQSINHSFYWSEYSAYSEAALLYAAVIIAVGMLSFVAGKWLAGREGRRYKGERVGGVIIPVKNAITWLPQAYLVLLILVLIVVIYHQGMAFFTSSRSSKLGQVESLAQMGLYIDLPRAVALAVLLFSLSLSFQRWRVYRKLSNNLLLIVLLAIGVNLVINYPLSVARFWMFGFLLSIMWGMFPPRHVLWRVAFVVVFSLFQFTLFPLYSLLTRNKGGVEFNADSIREYLSHGDFDGFQSIVNITLYIQDNGFELGRNLISVGLFFIPRAFWDKAEPLGVAAAKHMEYEYTNLSAPIYGELYADLGLFSLVLGMGVIGFGLRKLDGYYNRCLLSNVHGVNTLVTAVLAGYMIILLRGSLLGVVPSIVVLIGTLLIALWIFNYTGKWAKIKL